MFEWGEGEECKKMGGNEMKHGSLFSGIGGFELAAEWAGWENVFHCEINPFGQKTLKYHWPNSISYHDIKSTDFTIHRGTIDVLTGGFPCQPYSAAGKRLGKEDERHLWPEMLRAIREIQPRWIVGENVLGLTNWSGGLVFEEVQTDLEAEGYEVQAYVLPACGVNAPHRRDRVWFVAYSRLFGSKERQFEPMGIEQFCKERTTTNTTSNRRIGTGQGIEIEKGLQQRPESAGKLAGRFEGLCFQRNAANTECKGFQKSKQGEQFEQLLDAKRNDSQDATDTKRNGLQGSGKNIRPISPEANRIRKASRVNVHNEGGRISGNWDEWPTQSPICSRNDGVSSELVGITISKHRNESIKAYGNAIVPQVVYQIFKAINDYELA